MRDRRQGKQCCSLQDGSLEPYGVKAAELQAVKDMVKNASLLEVKYFSRVIEDYQ